MKLQMLVFSICLKVNLSSHPRSNPFVIKKSQKPIDQALLSTLQTVPGLGEKKALALLQQFASMF